MVGNQLETVRLVDLLIHIMEYGLGHNFHVTRPQLVPHFVYEKHVKFFYFLPECLYHQRVHTKENNALVDSINRLPKLSGP
ncbi:hypothetical protein LguiA_008572 [Lonicera macranthoides]